MNEGLKFAVALSATIILSTGFLIAKFAPMELSHKWAMIGFLLIPVLFIFVPALFNEGREGLGATGRVIFDQLLTKEVFVILFSYVLSLLIEGKFSWEKFHQYCFQSYFPYFLIQHYEDFKNRICRNCPNNRNHPEDLQNQNQG